MGRVRIAAPRHPGQSGPRRRRKRLARLAFLVWGALVAAALAQPYPGLTPVPRTTDPARAHELANAHEIDERIRIALADGQRAEWGNAAAEFQRVLALRPGEPQGSTAYYGLAIAQEGLGSLTAAVASLESAIARDPGFLAAHSNLVCVEFMRGDLVAARKAADAYLAVAPDAARALYTRGLIALRASDAATALGDFRTLVKNNPSYPIAHYNLALAETQLENLPDAERELRKVLALAPGYALARVALGAVLLREGKREEAASLASPEELANAQLVPSAAPALLAPINELGRTGWACKPEQAAGSVDARSAELPNTPGPSNTPGP
jgi:tetratricopeptide (TPR) repeat protein